MIRSYLESQIKSDFPYHPTLEQEMVLKSLSEFYLSHSKEEVFILRGYAGTGKTSLVGALVKTMNRLQQKTILLAPTGRAAKVFSSYANHPAYTIHKKIYRQRIFSGEVIDFALNENINTHTLFIVDEASMISNEMLSGAVFGTGRLLDDLIHFVYSGENCRLLIMGDTAQLPPVNEEESPALSANILKGYGLHVWEMDLTQVVRQAQESGILWNATRIRQLITENHCTFLSKIKLSGFADIQIVNGNELINTLISCYEHDGQDETIVICRSNKQANLYNRGIRQSILHREDELNAGDLLMVVKNNYYWTEGNKDVEFIANGDIAVVHRVKRTRELYGFHFAEVLLSFPAYADMELEASLLLDTLHFDTPTLPKTDNDKLFYAVLEDYADIPLKRDRMKKMKVDPYYNALQVKYAYALTCHKAQGGQWKNVILNSGYMKNEIVTPDYFRWLYTAFTRATQMLYLVN
ncbi:ATP-dependent RecD-like DNA helicase [termite gut metagenome]|uniref:ATP-dependent RecD-like DNA helicase n=1 Tax=termite gut metagenome TaxID=433724 RepID=A0A5J4R129_9ZZZZ